MNRPHESAAGTATNGRALIIGAGPAGLTAAWELAKLGVPAALFEADAVVGGIARTGEYRGYRYDIGGHRFFTKVDFVQEIWDEILGADLIQRPRLSRIFYRGKFFDYPLRPANALRGLGPFESIRIGFSFLKAKIAPSREEKNLEQWVSNRFGRRLFEIFFKTYTEKVWGIPCTEIGADWAAQRIKNLDLLKAVRNALLPQKPQGKGEIITTLIDSFLYPRLGPGMMWERCRELLESKGYPTHLSSPVVAVRHQDGRATGIEIRQPDGQIRFEPGEHVVSSMPMRDLILAMDPPAPPEVREAALQLRYRDFLTVVLIIDQPELFPDNWIYIHSPDVKLGRIQNFKNWSPEMVPDQSRTCLGLEYFVQEGDEFWNKTDADLVELGRKECAILGLAPAEKVIDGCVLRMPKAYPVYDGGYQNALATMRAWLETIPNLQLIGRYGQHRYNNQDHSMATAVYAARNIAGENYDVWSVNVEEEYHEEARKKVPSAPAAEARPATVPAPAAVPASAAAAAGGGRAVPQPASRERELESMVTEAFARYDAVALGAAIGVISGLGLFLATSILLLKGGKVVGPMLSLLGNYLLGYQVTWGGAFLGFLEASVGGFVFGFVLAKLINLAVGLHEAAFRRRAEMAQILEP